ncbi:voltage-gated monoatomic cation channel TMEM109 [Pterocles gutturalis]
MRGDAGGHWALLALLLCVPSLRGAAGADTPGGLGDSATAADDPLSRLGRAAWAGLESWVGPQPLRMVAESLAATLWVVSSGISVALTTLCGVLGDILGAAGFSGEQLVRRAALGPSEVQRVLVWGAVALAGWRLLGRLRGLLAPLLRWVTVPCFLVAFLHVVTSRESPTAQAGMLLGLWVFYTLLGRLLGSPDPNSRLDAAIRSLEWKVEELQRRQKWGGPRNREE